MVAQLKFEDLLPYFEIDGGATATYRELQETQPGGKDDWTALPNIEPQISTDQPFKFIIRWKQKGPLATLINPAAYWRIEILLEKMGVDEFELNTSDRVHEVAYRPIDGHTYTETIQIDRRKVTPGVYRPVVMVNLCMPKGSPDRWAPVAGFAEFKPIQFYED